MTKILENAKCPKCECTPFRCDVIKKYSPEKIRVKCHNCHREMIIDLKPITKKGDETSQT